MKLVSKIKTALLLLSSVTLVSCDSSTELPFGGSQLSDITPTDDEVIDGELFTFVESSGGPQELDNLRITSTNTAIIGEFTEFIYTRTGEFTATIESTTEVGPLVDDAVVQLFSTDNAANTEIRSLLLVPDNGGDEPELTDVEFERLIELLNIAGAGVSENPNVPGELIISDTTIYTLTSTATQEGRQSGLVGGDYAREATSVVIIFNITTLTDGEGNSFQFYFPAAGAEVVERQVFEQGTYTLQLINEVGF